MTGQFSLLRQRRFGPFFVTQFLGAFNDNVFKNALTIMLAFTGASRLGIDSNILINLAAGLFILPFFLFSATAGQVADKYEMAGLIRNIKLMEIVIMLLAAIALFADSLLALLCILFLMGAQSTFFGPIKYAIMPLHLHRDELVGGNAMVETGTFLAILLGTILGGILVLIEPAWFVISVTVVVLALLGAASSLAIPAAPAAAPDHIIRWNPITETIRLIALARQQRSIFLSILGISWFWFVGAAFLAQVPNYTREVLSGDESVVTLLLAVFSLGIGAGSLLCERLSSGRIEPGIVPLGALGITFFGADLYFASDFAVLTTTVDYAGFMARDGSVKVLLDLALVGLFGGFFIVPLFAMIQSRSEAHTRARVIAANNVMNALFMVAAALAGIVFLAILDIGIPEFFLLVAMMNAAVAVFIFKQIPEFSMRFLVYLMGHLMYRVRTMDLHHIPESGPAVLVCNHVSFVDAVLLAGACPRPVRFVMDRAIFSVPVLNFIFRTARTIPICSRRSDEQIYQQAFASIREALAAGDVVCIFPEGMLTRDGNMNPFRKGIERIVEETPVPVVPMALRGLWGSFFSHRGGPAFSKRPRRFWSRIEIEAAPPVAPSLVTADRLFQQVASMRGDHQ